MSAISAARAAEAITFQSLLREMADPSSLARWPDPAYLSVQESSHDRTKNDPSNPATWHNNQDMGQFNRVEENQGRKEWVIMEHEGPGAIVRIWLPLYEPQDKTIIRFYFDGAKEPGIAVKFNDLLSGKSFVKPPFAFVSWNQQGIQNQEKNPPETMRGVGGDLYLPIPFAKGCKITLDAVPFYYHVGYREYPAGTDVKTFSMADFQASAGLVKQVGDELARMPEPGGDPDASVQTATLAPGEAISQELPAGGKAIDSLRVSIDPKELPQALRSALLVGEFDDQQTIWCPVGEFFGCGPRLQPVFDSYRSVSDKGGCVARWIMPYQHSARVMLQNVGKDPIHVTLAAHSTDCKWDDRSMYFHADWHSEHDIKTRPRFDWNYLNVEGKGVYVGDTLSAYSPTAGWYGEGDERIYVDGEKFPSHLGTGTEDYYGYAWGMATYFSSPFISTPRREIASRDNWKGYTTTSRVRPLDAIPFTRSLKHDMEIWDWDDTKLDYAVGLFWYGSPGARSNLKPDPKEAQVALHAPPEDFRTKIAGAIECEDMKVVEHTGDFQIGTQDGDMLGDGHWSAGKQLFVQSTKAGDSVTLSFPAPDNSPHKLTLYATRSYDYATLRFSVNGKPVEKQFDAYSPTPATSGAIELGTFEPKDESYQLRAEVIGANPASRAARYYFGLDCVVVSKP